MMLTDEIKERIRKDYPVGDMAERIIANFEKLGISNYNGKTVIAALFSWNSSNENVNFWKRISYISSVGSLPKDQYEIILEQEKPKFNNSENLEEELKKLGFKKGKKYYTFKEGVFKIHVELNSIVCYISIGEHSEKLHKLSVSNVKDIKKLITFL